MDSASLLVEIEKKRFLFSVEGSLGGLPQVQVVLEILDIFGWPWAPTY